MATYYDDNFGHWEGMDGPDAEENREFYKRVQRQSVWKRCAGCDRRVRIMPQYAYCNACATKREQGYDI